MPFLANASAEVQGRALAEVCTVYGVTTVALGERRHGSPDPVSAHAAEHCALTALTAFAAGDSRMGSMPAASPEAVRALPRMATAAAADASARWAARLRHGPPHTS